MPKANSLFSLLENPLNLTSVRIFDFKPKIIKPLPKSTFCGTLQVKGKSFEVFIQSFVSPRFYPT